MAESFIERRSGQLLTEGLTAFGRGEIEKARDEFKASARVRKSAEALTYWGWMESQLGQTERAIDLCKEAIAIDPDFGNPYNDIGSYLVSMGRTDDAIPWFLEAIDAPRYEPRHFPHVNLAKVYLMKKEYALALEHFEAALEFSPDEGSIINAIKAIKDILKSQRH